MSDNTSLNSGSGGDVIRTIQRSPSTTKTEVVQLDFGGEPGSESLVSKDNPLLTAQHQQHIMEQILVELKTISRLLTTLGDPFSPEPDEISNQIRAPYY